LGVSTLLLVAAVAVWRVRIGSAIDAGVVAIDYRSFVEEGKRFLAAGTPYLPYQLGGPYEAMPVSVRQPADVPFLYPPPFALVCAALTVLPALVWWAVPVTLLAYLLARLRPAPWAWPILAAVLVWPNTSAIFIVGGTTMWVAALTAGGILWHWPSAFIFLKPSFAPLTLIGISDRRWWVALGVLALASLLLLPLWFEYVDAIRNATDLGLLYSAGDFPLVLAPLIAWAARTTRGNGERHSRTEGSLDPLVP
jgi:hypothetical protein